METVDSSMFNLQNVLLGQLDKDKVHNWIQANAYPYMELMSYYRCAIMEVETKFNVLNEELSIQYDSNPIETIKSRLKSPQSIIEKMQRKGIPLSVKNIEENLFDIAGVRVICSHPADIYRLEKALLRQDDVQLIQEKDYIKNPKANGYRSLHLIIETPIFLHDHTKMMKVEVQLRTISQDWWASLEHKIRYKKGIEDTEWVNKELLECAEVSAALDARMENIQHYVQEGKKIKESVS